MEFIFNSFGPIKYPTFYSAPCLLHLFYLSYAALFDTMLFYSRRQPSTLSILPRRPRPNSQPLHHPPAFFSHTAASTRAPPPPRHQPAHARRTHDSDTDPSHIDHLAPPAPVWHVPYRTTRLNPTQPNLVHNRPLLFLHITNEPTERNETNDKHKRGGGDPRFPPFAYPPCSALGICHAQSAMLVLVVITISAAAV